MLHQILVLNPVHRPESEQILQHSYVSKYFPSEAHTIPEVTPHTIVLDIDDNNQLEIDDYQDRLYDIVKRSKKKKAMKRLNIHEDTAHGQLKVKDTLHSKMRSREKENLQRNNKTSSHHKIKSNTGTIKLEDDNNLNSTNDYNVTCTSDNETNDINKKNYIAYNKHNVTNYSHNRRKDAKQHAYPPAVANISNEETPVLVTSKTYHIDKNHVKHVSKTWLEASTYEVKKSSMKERKRENNKIINNMSDKYNNTGETLYQPKVNQKVACKKNEFKVNVDGSSNKKQIPSITYCEEIESELYRKYSMSNSQQTIDRKNAQDNMKNNQNVRGMQHNTEEKQLKTSSHTQLQNHNGHRSTKYYLQDNEIIMHDGVYAKQCETETNVRFKKYSSVPFITHVNIPHVSRNTLARPDWVEPKVKKSTAGTGTETLYTLSHKGNHVYHGDNDTKSSVPDYDRTEISMGRKVERKLRNSRFANKPESQHRIVKDFNDGVIISKNFDSNENKYTDVKDPLEHLFKDKNSNLIEDTTGILPVYSVAYVPSRYKVGETMQSVHDNNERRHSDYSLKYTEKSLVCNGDNHTNLEEPPYSYHNNYASEISDKSSAHSKQFIHTNCLFDKILNYYNPTNSKDNSTPNYTSTKSTQIQKQPSNNNFPGTNMDPSGSNVREKYCGNVESSEGNNIFQCFKKNKTKVKTYFDYSKQFNEKLNNMHKLSVLNFNIAPIGMDGSDVNDDMLGTELNNNHAEVNGNHVRLLKPNLNENVSSDLSVSDGNAFCRYCDW